jgi:choice-of-anchor C domain-containing protein
MRTLTLACALAALFLLCNAGSGVPVKSRKPKPVELLINGSFEEGPDPGMWKPLDKGSKAIKGWTVTRGQIDYVGTFWQAADGKRSIDLHGSPGYGGIQQTFATKKGQRYRVTFSIAGTPGIGAKRMGVGAAGQKAEFRCDGTKFTKEKMGWATHKWEFIAEGNKTTLEFYTLETTDPARGAILDNASVKAVSK